MATYNGSAFGNISGKALGVVAGSWKGQNYVRSYVVPANPRTQAQTETRTLFKDVAQWGKNIVGIWLNTMTAPKPKKASPYNLFVKRNMDAQRGNTFSASDVVLAEGSLPLPATSSLTVSKASGLEVTFSTEITGDSKDTDIVGVLLYDETKDVFVSATAPRSAGTINATLPAVMANGDSFIAWLVVVSEDKTMSSDQKKEAGAISA